MSNQEPEIKRWTAKKKARVVVDILKGKTAAYDLKPSEVESWVEEGLACRL